MPFGDTPVDPEILSIDDSVQDIRIPPFLRIDNHLISIKHITSINFIPDGLLSRVGNIIYFNEDIAEQTAMDKGTDIETFTTPILVVDFVNKDGKNDYIRRHGEKARRLWIYVTTTLSAP